MVWLSSADTHDHMQLDKLKHDANTIHFFDRGCNDRKVFEKVTLLQTSYVNRLPWASSEISSNRNKHETPLNFIYTTKVWWAGGYELVP